MTEINLKAKTLMLNLLALHFFDNLSVYMLLVYDAFWKHTLSWASWYFYQYLILAPYRQVNTVKSDILKLFDSIEKSGMCNAFTIFKFPRVTVNVHL